MRRRQKCPAEGTIKKAAARAKRLSFSRWRQGAVMFSAHEDATTLLLLS